MTEQHSGSSSFLEFELHGCANAEEDDRVLVKAPPATSGTIIGEHLHVYLLLDRECDQDRSLRYVKFLTFYGPH